MLKGRLEKSLTVVLLISCFHVLQCLAQGNRDSTGECEDAGDWCSTWKTLCEVNAILKGNCPKSCGTCAVTEPDGWTSWSQWTECTASCGGGTQSKSRSCNGDESKCDGDSTEEQDCNEKDCPACQDKHSQWCKRWKNWVTPRYCKSNKNVRENCQASCGLCEGGGEPTGWTEWKKWSQCTVTCGGGTRERMRRCQDGTGSCPGFDTESEDCETQDCPVPGWNEWSNWSQCTVTCDGGSQERTRTCEGGTPGTGSCLGSVKETKSCETEDCPEWNEWDDWSQCSVTCGGGTRERTRTCQGDMGSCSGSATENESCEPQECPEVCEDDRNYQYCVHRFRSFCSTNGDFAERCKKFCGFCTSPSKWSEWTEWVCDVTCGTGIKTRTRMCLEGDCEEPNEQTEECVEEVCPPDKDGYGQWTEYGPCSDTCGGGIHSRTRNCVSGGCAKHSEEIENCNEQECPSDNCKDSDMYASRCGGWTDFCDRDYVRNNYCRKTCNNCPVTGPLWSDYGPCSVTCEVGLKTRTKGAISQSITCFGPDECVTGYWDEWSQWSTCSKTCAGGETSRTRVCSAPGACTGSDTEEKICETNACPYWDNWESWSSCSTTCGPGESTRKRECINGVPGELGCRGSDEAKSDCKQEDCKVAEWTQWEPWTDCSMTCSDGVRKRTRQCTISGKCVGQITGNEEEQGICNTQPCPYWGSWEPWSSCSTTCGPGKSTRKRKCMNGTPNDPGCLGSDEAKKDCNREDCKVAEWTQWADWTDCSVTCGGGESDRTRQCTITGKCAGTESELKQCNTQDCPFWQDWSNWSECTHTCGGGKRRRSRLCSTTGKCDGLDKEEEDCNTQDCPEPTVSPTEWSDWTSWATCTKTCGRGTKIRKRTCADNSCPGRSSEDKRCNTQDCPDISNWSKCTKTCGGGTQRRYIKKKWEFKPCNHAKCKEVACSAISPLLRNRYGPDKSKCCNNKHLPLRESCGRNDRGKRVIGGINAREKAWPWMAALYTAEQSEGFCGGVILNSEWVITAAHCFAEDDGRRRNTEITYYWIVGITKLSEATNENLFEIKEIIYKDYVYPKNDILLTKLAKPLTLDSYTYPLCLPHGEVTPEDSTCHVLGWGVSTDPNDVTNHLQELSIWNYNKGVCVESYGKDSNLATNLRFLKESDDYLCAGSIATHVDSCSGDSGGPLLCQRCESCTWYLAGLVSFGPTPCAKTGTPGIYTKVVNYEDWIFATTGMKRHHLTCEKAP